MRFYEFEAKQILRKFGVPIPEGKIAYTAEEAVQIFQSLDQEVVIKAQVLSGVSLRLPSLQIVRPYLPVVFLQYSTTLE